MPHGVLLGQCSSYSCGWRAQVSAFVTAAQIKFLLLHDGRSEDSVKGFFKEVYDGYLRVRTSTPMPVCTAF